MWFRAFLLIVTFIAWAAAFWLASHESENANVLSRYSTNYFAIIVFVFCISIVLSILHFGSAYRWIFEKRHNIFLTFISTAVAIAGLELLVRAIDPIGISYYEHAKRYHLDKIADDELYYRHPENDREIYQDVSVTTNEFGMRDTQVLDKSPGELRILFLGDSVTFGWGAKQEDTFARRVGEIMQKGLGSPVRSLNTGVGSYNTANQAAVLKRYGEELDPNIVVLMYVGNDIDPISEQKFDPWSKNSFSDKSPPESIALFLGKSWVYRLITHIARFRDAKGETRLSTTSEGWLQSVLALRDISDFCRSANIPLVVFMYRMTPNLLEDDIGAELNSLSSELNFYFEDVLPWFADKDIRQLVNSSVDSHPNEEGHKILAGGIVNALQQVVPSPSRDADQWD